MECASALSCCSPRGFALYKSCLLSLLINYFMKPTVLMFHVDSAFSFTHVSQKDEVH